MNKMSKRIWIYSLVVAGLLLLVGTASSPLFPYNVWDDANCFFTVGKSVMGGKVLYRDIFEQKGLYLYVIYGLGSLVSRTSFIGIYFIEVISMTVFLGYAGRILTRYVRESMVYVALPILGSLVIGTTLFEKGGSAEELCLPCILIVLCHIMEAVDVKGKGLTVLRMLVDGALLALVFWIKYTLIFPIVFAMLIVFIACLVKKQWGKALLYVGLSVAGFVLASLPALIYFAMNGALGDLWFGYFYSNIFLYHEPMEFVPRLKFLAEWLCRYARQYTLLFVFIVLGMAGFIRRHKKDMGIGRFFLPAAVFGFWLGCMVLPTVIGQYYPLPSVVFLVFGMVEVGELMQNRNVMNASLITVPILCIACIVYTWFSANGYFLHDLSKEELAPVQFAEIIKQKPGATVLNYGCLDTGIYTLADVEPTCKYFCRLNLDSLEEMNNTQNQMVADQKVDFIVMLNNNKEPDEIAGYEQVAHVEQYLTGAMQYHLYQKVAKK